MKRQKPKRKPRRKPPTALHQALVFGLSAILLGALSGGVLGWLSPKPVPYSQSGLFPARGTSFDRDKANLFNFTQHVTRVMAVTITEEALPTEALLGYSILDERKIALNSLVPPGLKFNILAHEAAHFLAPATLKGPDAEAFAEAVRAGVCARWGVKDEVDKMHYLSMFKSTGHVTKDWASEIAWAITVLSGK